MDLLPIGVGVVAFILGAALGWLVARSSFTTAFAELNSKLVLERRVNKQLRETVQIDAVPHFTQTPDLATPVEPAVEPAREPARAPMVLSG
jgi:hypothetical protein